MKYPLNNLQILSCLIIFCIFFGITHDSDLIKNANAQMSEEIVVAKVNGDEIQLKEVLDIIDQLPLDYQNQPLASYFDQVVDEVINTRLAAKAGEKSDLSDDPIVIEAMRIAAQKVLAENWLRIELAKSVTQEALGKAYDAYVADETSR